MTREDEIKQERKRQYDFVFGSIDYCSGFEAGAKWADAHPNKDNMATAYKAGEAATIDKACEWLKEYIEWNDLCTLEDIEQFRKAMKGE